MLNYIWFIMLVAGFLLGVLNGRAQQVTQAAIGCAADAVELAIALAGIMCLWTGLMNIAEKSGMIKALSKIARPFMESVFSSIPPAHPAMSSILMNLAANFLGLGNAATPLGIKAMAEMQKLNKTKDTATNDMCMFLVLNTSAIQLLPATIIALRTKMGSRNPSDIMVSIWVSSVCATIAGIIACKLFSRISQVKEKGVKR